MNMAKLMESKRQKTFTPKSTAPLLSIAFIFTLLLFTLMFEADTSGVFRIPCVDNIKIIQSTIANIDELSRWIFHLAACIYFQIKMASNSIAYWQ